ncbi:hypothetical protein HNO88_000782 [Novosphingobium chloroacetimidivorans]|uniref:Uncharacterized protein n=1 Tax=Novosphingobium chloroacetimidivorans TaxID=1428314 RepID=A0A7W7K7P0_9SPHN|nr:hypothetical protein [Novosphingobium chloroacetimidivorans]MBB4857475.1 hypothetical protein [Novosphingobium chloroacetimidivorans]
MMIAAAAMASMLGTGVVAEAKDHRRNHDSRYERGQSGYNRAYRTDRDRRYDRRDRDRRREVSNRDRRGYNRNGNYGDMARRNYEYERNLQTCYRDGRRVC